MTFDVQAAIRLAAEKGPDMNETTGGGSFEYEPPGEGPALATLIGYIETGKKTDERYNKIVDTVQLIFELAGGKSQPRVLEDGTKIPHRVSINLNLSLNEKANFYKLFRKLNYKGDAKHMAELLDHHWLVNVRHRKSEDGKRTYVNLDDIDRNYTFRPPVRIEGDELAGDVKKIPIAKPERLSELRLFLWDFPSKAMWDSLYIDGSYEARTDEKGNVISPARSKNVIQERIKEAINWADSPMAEILKAGGELDLDPLATPSEPQADTPEPDVLADVADTAPAEEVKKAAKAEAKAVAAMVEDDDPLAGL